MKSFWRRLKYYGLGFGLGIIFVIFFFDNRGCSWMPSSRVKNTILGRILVVADKDKVAYDKLKLSDQEIVEFLNDGDVNIGGSHTQGNPKVYEITKEIRGKEIKLWFTLPNEAFISEVIIPKGSIEAVENTKVGVGRMIRFPLVDNIVFLKEDDQNFNKEKEKFKLTDSKKIMKYLKKTGYIDFEHSKLTAKPYPIQKILFTTPTNVTVHASSYWFEEHVTIEGFDSMDTLDITKH